MPVRTGITHVDGAAMSWSNALKGKETLPLFISLLVCRDWDDRDSRTSLLTYTQPFLCLH